MKNVGLGLPKALDLLLLDGKLVLLCCIIFFKLLQFLLELVMKPLPYKWLGLALL